MRKLAFVCLMLVAMLYAPLLRAQEVHAEGCKDSPLISRFPGSAIHSCGSARANFLAKKAG
jgi:hypothetical protein